MSQQNILTFAETTDSHPHKTIKIVSLLSFIGCVIYPFLVFFVKWGQAQAPNPAAIQQLTAAEKSRVIMGYETWEYALFAQHAIFFIVIAILNIALCAYGAWLMRKLKRKGCYLYLIGQWLPFVAIGFQIEWAYVFGYPYAIALYLAIPCLFSIVYATQLKHMK